ncbi:MAG: hypothetical protein MPW13_02795 [Candidatus Manganitrophus sp.]|nr:hypothetical protein [Candidatus Manganitrophus sp.]
MRPSALIWTIVPGFTAKRRGKSNGSNPAWLATCSIGAGSTNIGLTACFMAGPGIDSIAAVTATHPNRMAGVSTDSPVHLKVYFFTSIRSRCERNGLAL